MDIKDIVDIIPLDNKTNELAQRIVNEDDLVSVQNLTHLFNLNQAKKNALRVIKLNELLDKVTDQIVTRFEQRPGEFSNNDLLNYMQVTQSAIDRANKSLNLVDETPAIQLNQVNINVNEENVLSKDSRDKVTDAIKSIMSKLNNLQEPSKLESIIVEPVINDEENTVLLNSEENEFNLIKGEEE